RVRQVVSVYDVGGAYEGPWEGSYVLEASAGATLVECPGITPRQHLDDTSVVVDGPMPSGVSEGKLHLALGDQQVDIPVVTEGALDPPGLPWRLFRINFQ